ncbi:MAG: glycosyltransferase [Gordonia sp.]|uniref:glycosyltransferase family 4 protein n=1 Tax=Gordonia sp. (in: high G+C Gram-positive bacteria) TaxID=84139 RepID=UPI000C3635AB|nr:glycosyltransferase [Gordonia sp. (in: high G+C Gram-positive bacteria)]
MRVLHILNELDDVGNGIVNVAVDLALSQAKLGFTVAVASSGGAFVGLIEANGVIHYPFAFSTNPVMIFRNSSRLADVIADFRPEIVHSHMLAAAGTALVLSIRSRFVRSGSGFLTVSTVHNEYQRGVAIMGLSDVTVGVSRAVEAAMRRRVRRGANVCVYNGAIGSQRRVLPEVATRDCNNLSLVTVGAVSERKGSDIVYEVWTKLRRKHPGLELIYVGNPDWTEFVDMCSGVEGVRFVGYSSTPASYVSAASVFVLPSRREPFGLAALEARELGVPVVASAVDGLPEVLDWGRAGQLVPPEDVSGFTSVIDDLLSDPVYRKEWCDRATRGLDRFTVESMGASYERVYRRHLGTVRRMRS